MNSIVYYFLHRPHFESVNAMQQKMVTEAHLQYASLWLVTYDCKMYSAVVGLIDSDNTFLPQSYWDPWKKRESQPQVDTILEALVLAQHNSLAESSWCSGAGHFGLIFRHFGFEIEFWISITSKRHSSPTHSGTRSLSLTHSHAMWVGGDYSFDVMFLLTMCFFN